MSDLYSKAQYQLSEWAAKVHSRKEREIFIAGAAGPGKALSLNTIVPTTNGMKYLRDVKPLDHVFGLDGKPKLVLAESEVFENRPCYKLRIGREDIIADENHLWLTTNNFVLDTKTLYKTGFQKRIPFAKPTEMEQISLPVDPYVLGILLVRGQPSDRSKITTWDPYINKCLLRVGYTLHQRAYQIAEFSARRDVINELIPKDKRRIPEQFQLSSFAQRVALVEGILDGFGQYPTLTDEEDKPFLIDLFNVLAGLGFGPKFKKTTKGHHFLDFSSKKFRLARATENPRVNRAQRLYHVVTSIEPCESVPTKCLKVEDSIFLVTRSHIPTHNSMTLLMDPMTQVQIEHLRMLQDDKLVDQQIQDPELRQLIKSNPINRGHSQGSVIHLRRTLPRLTETINRSKRIFPSIDPEMGIKGWREKDHTWTFSSGLQFRFGHCKDRGDHLNYLGLQFDHIAFDELVEFNKEQYDFITSRLRSGDDVLRNFMKILSASNPRITGNKGEDVSIDDPTWVKKYFVDPWPEGNRPLRKKVVRKDGTVEYLSRIYIPATLYDNPNKDFIRDYELTLLSKPKHIRDAYLYGKWDTVMGSHFGEIWNPTIHVCKPFKIPQDWPVFRAGDWGFATNGNIGFYAVSPENTCYKFYELTFKQKDATEVAHMIKYFEEKNKLWDPEKGSKIFGPMDTQLWEERGSSFSNKAEEMAEVGVNWCKADKRSRETNCEVFTARLMSHQNFTRPPGIVFFENCKYSIQTIPSLNTDPNNLECVAKGGQDHAYDETTYAMQYARQIGLEPPNYKSERSFRDDSDDLDVERYY